MGYVDGMNLYEHVNSAPICRRDPQGTIVVGFRGWKGSFWAGLLSSLEGGQKSLKKGKIAAEVIRGVVDTQKGVQPARSFSSQEADEALDWVRKELEKREKKRGACIEPVYIVGYSLGCRTAQVVAARLSTDPAIRKDKAALRKVVFFDFNWGAFTFDPTKGLLDSQAVYAPQYDDPWRFPRGPDYEHFVSNGTVDLGGGGSRNGQLMGEHTQIVFDIWKKYRDGDGTRERGMGYTGWSSGDKHDVGYLVGLVNTSGHDIEKWIRGFPVVTPTGAYSGDHFGLGADYGYGQHHGKSIAKDYWDFILGQYRVNFGR
jgi:pimeloyl-ACP methyl ester carboxylesterase